MNRCRPREARSIASSAARAEEQHARQLGGRHPIEHPVPDAVDAFGEGAIAEGRHGAEVAQGLHHRQRHAGGEGGAGQRQGDLEERAQARAAEAAGGLERGRALGAKGGAGEEIDVGVEHQGHHQRDAAPRAELGQADARAEPVAQRGLERPRELEDAQEGEPDHVRGNGQRQDQRPLEHAVPGEAVVDHEPRQQGAHHQGARPDSGEQRERVQRQLHQLGAPEVQPEVDVGRGEGGQHHHVGNRDDARHQERGGGPGAGEGARGRPAPEGPARRGAQRRADHL